MLRTILAFVAGTLAMWLTVSAIEFASHALYPPPAGLDPRDPAHLAAIVAASPPAALAMLVLAWVAGAFVGGATAAAISRRHPRVVAVLVALLVMAGVAGMAWLVPAHPRWVSIPGLLLPVPAALLAARLVRRRDKA